MSSTSSGSATASASGVGVAGEQVGRHHVHALVGALGREDGGGEQLEGVAVVERAELAACRGTRGRAARGCGGRGRRRCAGDAQARQRRVPASGGEGTHRYRGADAPPRDRPRRRAGPARAGAHRVVVDVEDAADAGGRHRRARRRARRDRRPGRRARSATGCGPATRVAAEASRRSASSRSGELLPAAPPAARGRAPWDLDVRPFVVGEDEDGWLAVNNRAFAGTPSRVAGPVPTSRPAWPSRGSIPPGSCSTRSTAAWSGSAGPRSTAPSARRSARST